MTTLASQYDRAKLYLNNWLDVPSTEGDDARQRKLLNIVLLGMAAFSVIILINAIVIWSLPASVYTAKASEMLVLIAGSLVLLVGIAIIYAINRYRSRFVAGWLLLLLLLLLISSTDTTEELTNGRSLFVYTIPILMASVFLSPSSSFYAAILASLAIGGLAASEKREVNTTAMVVFFVVAWLTWLAARSLQRALDDLRIINQELDARVAQRTQQLQVALEQVQTESSKNEAILTSIADGVIVFDQNEQVTSVNPATVSLLRLPSGELIGQSVDEVAATNPETHEQYMLLSLLKGNHHREDTPKLQWQGQTLSISFASVLNRAGEATGFVAVFRDYTREAQLEQMKDRFVSMASHELRTPLNAILGYSDMLNEGIYGIMTDPQRNILTRVVANSKRMLSLVNNILDQAQIAAGKLTIHPTPFEIEELMQEVSSVMTVLAQAKQITFETCIQEPFPPILLGDQQRLSQILINLVGNAIKFTDEGKITVNVFQSLPDKWVLEVRDTGRGIPEDAKESVFEAFQQVDDPITRNTEGSGLGLSIVRMLIKLMEGEIHLESELGKGSTFIVTLPLKTALEEE